MGDSLTNSVLLYGSRSETSDKHWSDVPLGCGVGCLIGGVLLWLLSTGKCDNKWIRVKESRGETNTEQTHNVEISDKDGSLEKAIKNYQLNVSPRIHKIAAEKGVSHVCRFEPSCSDYALEAIKKYGNAQGSWMATKRLARCNPLSKGGYDPVV